MSAPKFYTLTPHYPREPTAPRQVQGFRLAIDRARKIAAEQYCSVNVRNEADMIEWTVAFRVRGGRGPYGARCVVEVTR